VKIVCISDTHLMHLREPLSIPDGDVLIHAGDATLQGNAVEIQAFSDWFGRLPHKEKIFVAGNHDWGFQTHRAEAVALLPKGVHYLQDSGVEISGIKFWGSPWQPEFMNWAFNAPTKVLREKWRLIPRGTHVVITHGPPKGIGDFVPRGENVGCAWLGKRLEAIQPCLHVCGHIHGGYGVRQIKGTTYINASLCDEGYVPCQAPITFDIVAAELSA
jgi:Icc-related predicted phosphoesterase